MKNGEKGQGENLMNAKQKNEASNKTMLAKESQKVTA